VEGLEAEGARSTLLLVEDDRALAGLLSDLLADEGYAVTVARDGQQGLHLGLVRSWDLMILDRGLPAIEGVDLLARLRARGVHAPVLMLTARGTVADRVDGLDAGANDYLVKPFDVEELLARLRALLRRPLDQSE
jgi:DNA-binding response OmpR family regulator